MPTSKFFLVNDDVLAECRAVGAEPEFWEDLWDKTDFAKFLKKYETGYLGPFARLLPGILTHDAPVLEAGCGRGQYVCALKARGYDVLGLDFAEALIKGIKAARPELDVRVGDVRALPFEDESLGTYLSFGIIEHFWSESEAILREAHRALRHDGTIAVSVPHLNPLFWRRAHREFEALNGHHATPPDNFYQLHFTRSAFSKLLQRAGFTTASFFYYDEVHGIRKAYPGFNRIYEASRPFRVGSHFICKHAVPQILASSLSHMILAVAHKSVKS